MCCPSTSTVPCVVDAGAWIGVLGWSACSAVAAGFAGLSCAFIVLAAENMTVALNTVKKQRNGLAIFKSLRNKWYAIEKKIFNGIVEPRRITGFRGAPTRPAERDGAKRNAARTPPRTSAGAGAALFSRWSELQAVTVSSSATFTGVSQLKRSSRF